MNPPAGWHPDPLDPAIDRYWDGVQWTGETRSKDADAATQMINPGTGFGSQAGQPGKKRPKWPWIVGGVVVAFIGVGALGSAADKGKAEAPPAATTTSSSATSTTTMARPTTMAVAPLVPQSAVTSTPAYTPPPVTTTVAPAPTTMQPMPTQPAPVYTPPPEPAYTPPPAAKPQQSAGTVNPGSFCSTPGATGVTNKGTPMVCGVGSDGRDRWKSAG